MKRHLAGLWIAVLVSACQSGGQDAGLAAGGDRRVGLASQLGQKWTLTQQHSQYRNRQVEVSDYLCQAQQCKTPVKASYAQLKGGKTEIDATSFIGIVEDELLPEMTAAGYEKTSGPRFQSHKGHPLLLYTLHSGSGAQRQFRIVSVTLANAALHRIDVASLDEGATRTAHAEFLAATHFGD